VLSSEQPSEPSGQPTGVFATTCWSVVVQAGDSQSPAAASAMEQLCRTYWYPVYALVRRKGFNPDTARDFTQEFFAQMLSRDGLSRARRDRGRFRSFLARSVFNFLSDEWDKARAKKRDCSKVVSFDTRTAEVWLSQLPSDTLTPEKAFELRWAITLLEQVYQKLEAEHRRLGKAELFEVLRTTLAGPGNSAPYAELGARLGLNEGAVKAAVHRLRQRYRALLRKTIAETVGNEADAEDELRYLLRIVAGS